MKEYAAGQLRSGSKDGPVVDSPKQAVAIAFNEGRDARSVPKGFAHHHAEAGKAHKKGDHKAAMQHVGHMMAALKHAAPPDEHDQLEPQGDGAGDFADAGEASELAPPKSTPSSLRSRLKGIGGQSDG